MSTPTRDEVLETIRRRTELWELIDRTGWSNADNWIDVEDVLLKALTGDAGPAIIENAKADRATLSDILSPQAIRDGLAPHLVDYMTAINKPHGDFLSNLVEFRDDLQTFPSTVRRRNITYGTPGAAVGTGDGVLYRVTVDKYGNNLEGGTVETKVFTCAQDQNAATDGEQAEIFEVEGDTANSDFLRVQGSGLRSLIKVSNAKDSQSFLTNPSFSTFDGVAPTVSTPTVFTTVDAASGWLVDVGDLANFEAQLDEVYRKFPGESVRYAVRVKNTGGPISQIIQDNKKAKFADEVPYGLWVAVYRESSATGTIDITFGATTKQVDISTLNNAAWNVVPLDFGKGLYYENFTAQDLKVEFDVTLTLGSVILDDVNLEAFQLIDSSYWNMQGGETPFLKEDKITVVDVYVDAQPANRGILQHWVAHRTAASSQLGYAFTLASCPLLSTSSGTGGHTLLYADNGGSPDTITASTGDWATESFGFEVGAKLTIAGTTSNDGTYTIAAVSALVLTLIASDTLVNEGPSSAGESLQASPSIIDP